MVDLPRLAGDLVALPIRTVAAWRQGKPMHPHGAVFRGRLERFGSTPPWACRGWTGRRRSR